MDGTFKVVPKLLQAYQLLLRNTNKVKSYCNFNFYILHMSIFYRLFKFFIRQLLLNQKQEAYEPVFVIFKQFAPTLEPAIIITDYGSYFRQGLTIHNLNDRVVQCFFRCINIRTLYIYTYNVDRKLYEKKNNF